MFIFLYVYMSIRTLIKGMAAIIHRCANKGNNSIADLYLLSLIFANSSHWNGHVDVFVAIAPFGAQIECFAVWHS